MHPKIYCAHCTTLCVQIASLLNDIDFRDMITRATFNSLAADLIEKVLPIDSALTDKSWAGFVAAEASACRCRNERAASWFARYSGRLSSHPRCAGAVWIWFLTLLFLSLRTNSVLSLPILLEKKWAEYYNYHNYFCSFVLTFLFQKKKSLLLSTFRLLPTLTLMKLEPWY